MSDPYVKMRSIEVVFEDAKYNYQTQINGNRAEICRYFRGAKLQREPYPSEVTATPVAVRFLDQDIEVRLAAREDGLVDASYKGCHFFESAHSGVPVEEVEQLLPFIRLADRGHASFREVCLYFNELSALLDVVSKLREAGYRILEAFKSPKDSDEQLNFTLRVRTEPALQSELTDRFQRILAGLNIDPASVCDLHDGSIAVSIDRSRTQWRLFTNVAAAAGVTIRPRRSVYTNPIKLTDDYLVSFAKEAKSHREIASAEFLGFRIEPTRPQPPIPSRDHDWTWCHQSFDGPGDNRCGTAANALDCVSEIIEHLESEWLGQVVVSDETKWRGEVVEIDASYPDSYLKCQHISRLGELEADDVRWYCPEDVTVAPEKESTAS